MFSGGLHIFVSQIIDLWNIHFHLFSMICCNEFATKRYCLFKGISLVSKFEDD